MDMKMSLVLLICAVQPCLASLIGNTTKLIDYLLTGYDSRVLPKTDSNSPMRVKLSFQLNMLQRFDDLSGQLDFVGKFKMQWDDHRIVWKSKDWSNLSELVVPKTDVWYPKMIMEGSLNTFRAPGATGQNVRYFSDGRAMYYSQDLLSVSCDLDVLTYPYDKQFCTVLISPDIYNRQELVLSHLDSESEEKLENSEWEVTSTASTTNKDVFSIVFELKRRSGYIQLTLKAPIHLLGFLNPWVFFLPPESGERISFSITTLLSFTFYMGILTDHIPRGSKPIPEALYEVFINLIYSAAILLCTIQSLRLHMRSADKPISCWIKRLVWLLSFSCLQRKKRKTAPPEPNKEHSQADPPSYSNMQHHTNQVLKPSKSFVATVSEMHEIVENPNAANSSLEEITWSHVGNVFDIYMLIIFYIINISVTVVYIV